MIHHPIDYLEMLWQKPESTRKIIAFVSVSSLAIIIIGIWAITFSFPKTNLEQQTNLKQTSALDLSMFSALWQNIKSLGTTLKSLKPLTTNLENKSLEEVRESTR